MYGDLGSGKTTATKYIADFFGVTEHVTSPTFVIIKSYKTNQNLHGVAEVFHMDAYRLHGAPDAESVGLSEIFSNQESILIIEWPENIANILPNECKEIRFEHLGGNKRKISSNF
ncbi:MAG: tRNA threonylcarbamoyladenosine biosynthesis protein TsaE [bacterium ADurb.Bin212]|nr:MAG: tRNA threonylcarbamoyladenosine biosynthesis protein TsaE [bacterium ADurb.Bin212]